MGISFGSIATGLPKNIVEQIIAAEKIPIKKMEGRKSKIIAKQKLVSKLKGFLDNLYKDLGNNSNAKSLGELKVNTDENYLNVIVEKAMAKPSNHSIEVVQLARKSSAMSVGFESKTDSYVGVGYLQYQLPNGESKEVYIDSDHSSLEGVANLINREEDLGLTANVINDGSDSDEPWRLLLAVNDSGKKNKVSFPYFYLLDGDKDLTLDEQRHAQNAIVKIDGFKIEVPENKLKELIPGLTIDLKKTSPGKEINVEVKMDVEAMTNKIKDMIKNINEVLGFIHAQNNLDEKSDTTKTLGGDLILQTIESRIRSTIFKNIKTSKGNYRVGDIGITFQRDGSIKLDDKKLGSSLASDYNNTVEILAGRFVKDGKILKKEKGFINNLQDSVKNIIKLPGGVLANRKTSIKNKINLIDRQIEQKQRLIGQKEKNLKNKFARLEETMSRIKSQGAGLSALGAQGANPVTKL